VGFPSTSVALHSDINQSDRPGIDAIAVVVCVVPVILAKLLLTGSAGAQPGTDIGLPSRQYSR
jgi:hypothetical protein